MPQPREVGQSEDWREGAAEVELGWLLPFSEPPGEPGIACRDIWGVAGPNEPVH